MDISTIIGIVMGIGLLVGAIAIGGSLGSFVDIPSLLIVVGGTVAATLIMERLERVLGGFKVAMNAIRAGKQISTVDTIKRIVELSSIARREGVLALENEQIDDEFMAKGVRMAVDGLPEEEILSTLEAELVSMKDRHRRGQKLFKFITSTAPAMGMIGTLIGLVLMLGNMADPKAIGPAMAVALLTTLYGAFIANIMFAPMVTKLEGYTAYETIYREMVVEGLRNIARGESPRNIQDQLVSNLPPKLQEKLAAA